MYRKNRNKHRGGVLILVTNTIPLFQIEVDSPLELIGVYLHANTQANIIVGCFYCPPDSSVTNLDHLHVSLSAINSKYPAAKIFLGGNYKCPGIDCFNNCLQTHSYNILVLQGVSYYICYRFYLNQTFTIPTRGFNVPDLSLSSTLMWITSVKFY